MNIINGSGRSKNRVLITMKIHLQIKIKMGFDSRNEIGSSEKFKMGQEIRLTKDFKFQLR